MNISTRNKEETTNLETKLLKVKPRQSQAPQPWAYIKAKFRLPWPT